LEYLAIPDEFDVTRCIGEYGFWDFDDHLGDDLRVLPEEGNGVLDNASPCNNIYISCLTPRPHFYWLCRMETADKIRGLRICATLLLSALEHIEREDDEWSEVVRCGSEGKAIWMTQVLKDVIAPNLPSTVEVGAHRGALGWEISIRYVPPSDPLEGVEEVEDSCASESDDSE